MTNHSRLKEYDREIANINDVIESALFDKRTIFLSGEITDASASEVIKKLHLLFHEDQKAPISLFLLSDGGCLDSAMNIIDTMLILQKHLVVRTIAYQAHSAAAYILAFGSPGQRFCFDNSIIMMHRASLELGSDSEESQKAYVDFTNEVSKKIYAAVAKICGKKLDQFTKDISKALWLTGKAAKKYKLVDKIVEDISEIQ